MTDCVHHYQEKTGGQPADCPERHCISIVEAHHYRIEEPEGEFSVGTCLKCGYQREYKNHSSPMDYVETPGDIINLLFRSARPREYEYEW